MVRVRLATTHHSARGLIGNAGDIIDVPLSDAHAYVASGVGAIVPDDKANEPADETPIEKGTGKDAPKPVPTPATRQGKKAKQTGAGTTGSGVADTE